MVPPSSSDLEAVDFELGIGGHVGQGAEHGRHQREARLAAGQLATQKKGVQHRHLTPRGTGRVGQ